MQQLIEEGVQVDLTVTSPPYDNLRTYDDTLEWNWDIFTQIAEKLYHITREGGVVVWVVNDATIDGSETGTSFRQALYFMKIGFLLHDTMIFYKPEVVFPTFTRYYQCFEYMFIFSKGVPKTTNLLQDRKNKKGGRRIQSTARIDGEHLQKINGTLKKKKIKPYGVRRNVWKYPTGRSKSSKNPIAFEHPAIFPEQLAIDHIMSWSTDEDIVLDPMMGSGTTGVACTKLNRRFIGIEKVEKYFNIAQKRIDTSQTRLDDFSNGCN
jgi:site-specific DNA-methyltransferase (adenine-specific)